MRSIPDDDRKYDVYPWEVHTMIKIPAKDCKNVKNHSFNFGKCKVPAKDCKNVKNHSQN
jgi:hypothetical protein